MKILNPFLLFFLFPFFGSAQSLNGVYTGVLSNDSTTIRKDQSFEMALTEYKGKVFGYAYSTFIVNDTLYYIVKRVKGKVEGDICEVEDDDVISHNFPQKPEKKVFVTYTLRRNASDSVWKLDGNWKTNLTKKYYAISGKVDAKEEKDLAKSKLYQHLGDLDLQNTLAFEKPKEKTPDKIVKAKEDIAKNETKKDDKKDVAKNKIEPQEKTALLDLTMTERKTEAFVAKNETIQSEQNIAGKKIETSTKPDVKVPDNSKDAIVKNSTSEKQPESNLPQTEQKPGNKISSPANNPLNQSTNTVASNTNDKKPETVNANSKSVSIPVNNQPATSTNSIAKTDNKVPDNKTNNPIVNNQPKQEKDVAATNPPVNNNSQEKKLVSVPVTYGSTPANSNNTTKNPPIDKKTETSVAKQETKIPDQKTNTVSTNSPANQNEKKDVAASQKKPDAEFEFQDVKRTNRKLKPAATLVDGRITIPSETIFFKSDSLSIALYDNGEVDGDSVSVIINDEMFIEKQGLKSSAFRKTYYIPQTNSDSLLVVLYADNLGKFPPNTGLLQIKDGDEIFYVRFKADLNRNAAIVLRRKSK